MIAVIPVGTFPTGIATNPATNRIYVANNNDDTVSVIDGSANAVIATIPVGDTPSGVAVNATTSRVYVSNFLSNTVSVIDSGTNTVVATISTGMRPGSLATNPVTNRIYAVVEGTRSIAVIDGATNAVIQSIPVSTGMGTVIDVSVNAATNRIYVVNQVPNELIVIDGANHSILQRLSILGSVSVDVNDVTNRVYLGYNPLRVIDGATLATVGSVPLSGFGGTTRDSITVDALNNRIYVADFSADVLEIVDGASDTRTATLAMPDLPHSVGVIPQTRRVYVTNGPPTNAVVVVQDAATPAFSLTLAPATDTNHVGTPHTVTATLTDAGQPVAAKAIAFTVSGANSASGTATTNANGAASFTYTGSSLGSDSISACFDIGNDGTCGSGDPQASATKTWTNQAPVCTGALATPSTLWPPNRDFRLVTVTGVVDPDGDPAQVKITAITQDERVKGRRAGKTKPDAKLTATPNQALIRAERSGRGDGRVYRIAFLAKDSHGATCDSIVTVSVPRRPNKPAVDSAPPSFNSLLGHRKSGHPHH